MSEGNPFVVFEAEVYVTVEGSDAGLAEVWLGGCAERIVMNIEPDETLVEFHGHPFRTTHHGEEKHTIDLTNVWLLDINSTTPVGAMGMPRLRRNQRMTMVILWQDDDTGYWNKRVYFGVTWRGQRINELPLQEIPLRAERMVERSGLLNADTNPTALAEVVFFGGSLAAPIPIYAYDLAAGTFILADPSLTALAEIVAASGAVNITVDGTAALRADADGVFVNDFEAMGSPNRQSGSDPRIEFQINGIVAASLTSSGLLAVGNAFEVDDLSGIESAFVLADDANTSRAVIGPKGLYALGVSEFP
jgi:hypothetical protein